MRFLPPDEDIELYTTAFDDDMLGRAKISRALSDVLERFEDPLVVALDGRWGTGKSYFLKRWVGAHRLQNDGNALTIYFDAFAHDYLSDPLIALVGALSQRIPRTEKHKLDRVKEVAFKFVKPAARIALAIASYGATEALNGIGDAAAEAIKGEAGKAMDDFWAREEGRQAAMEEFRSAIQTLSSPSHDGLAAPLIIVVDELDRCRPDYALEVLEVIKHFFSVANVHFVLGVNLKALENSVKSRYGSEIDATSYLQKFLSFTVNLPAHIGDHNRTPSILKYLDQVGESMSIPAVLRTELKNQISVISRSNNISIRDIGKILSSTALLPKEVSSDGVFIGYRMVAVTLLITKVVDVNIFEKLLRASISNDELSSYLSATDQYINRRKENGDINPDFHHPSLLLFGIWSYLCNDGLLDPDREWPKIESAFDNFGRPEHPKRIPLSVYEDWIQVFRLSN
ncbi:KAP family P-loop NTPase fold protein [Hoeflea alexandrii]|uniref:KAP family P-loop NTPase fold protein n=1 Tax=Hoeflea alexandrii TaxID=288436 RepID=UPI0022AF553B|nr:P-loop NTPase fold protein [Hoeflea alexandrii]MCZ4287872.1 P-loop NTPase fold protein [Hoeflea alexandrii]